MGDETCHSVLSRSQPLGGNAVRKALPRQEAEPLKKVLPGGAF